MSKTKAYTQPPPPPWPSTYEGLREACREFVDNEDAKLTTLRRYLWRVCVDTVTAPPEPTDPLYDLASFIRDDLMSDIFLSREEFRVVLGYLTQ